MPRGIGYGNKGDSVSKMVAALAGADQIAGLAAALGIEPDALMGSSETSIDPFMQGEAIRGPRNRIASRPFATGVPYIFTGGSPFPVSGRERAAEQAAGVTALLTNLADVFAQNQKKRRKKGGSASG